MLVLDPRGAPTTGPIPALNLTYKGEEIYPRPPGGQWLFLPLLVSFLPFGIRPGASIFGGGVASFQSYHWNIALEADTNQTWNLFWGGGSSGPENQR